MEAEAVTCPRLQSHWEEQSGVHTTRFVYGLSFTERTVPLLRQPFGIWGNNRILDFQIGIQS